MDEVKDDADCPLSETQFVAERCDIWRMAYNMMRDCGVEHPEPADVLDVAMFIAGDNLRLNEDAD